MAMLNNKSVIKATSYYMAWYFEQYLKSPRFNHG